jgi:hypothetical protein
LFDDIEQNEFYQWYIGIYKMPKNVNGLFYLKKVIRLDISNVGTIDYSK